MTGAELQTSSTDVPLVSVVIVASRRVKELSACLDGLRAQTVARHEVVIVLVDATRELDVMATERSRGDPRVQVARCRGLSPSAARNVGAGQARAEVLYFLDDDVEIPPHALSELLETFAAHPEVDVVGGPNLTPPDDPQLAQVIGEVLASPVGTGLTRPRYVRTRSGPAKEHHLILCNLAVRSSVFESGIRFPDLFGGEENSLMGTATARGHRFWYESKLWVHHRRRRTLRGYAEQLYRYGYGRALAIRYAPNTFHVGYFAPVALLAYVSALPLLRRATPLAWIPLGGYLGAVALASLEISVRRRRPGWLPLLPPVFVMTHAIYAAGLAVTLARLWASSDGQEGNGTGPNEGAA